MKQEFDTIKGVTGLSIWNGKVTDQYLSQLKGNKAYKIFTEMENDAVIGTLLEAFTMPLLSAEFDVLDASDSEPDKRASELIRTCMDDMNGYSWKQHVLDMISMLTYGWAASEIQLKKRQGDRGKVSSKHNDGAIGVQILDPRGQETLERWLYEDKTLIGLQQRDPVTGQLIDLPMWKLLHISFRPRCRNPQGRSPMQGLYGPWYKRKNLEIFEGIGIERDLAGLPVIHLPYGASTADKARAFEIVRALRMDEEAGVVLPAPRDPEAAKSEGGNWKLELLTGGAKAYNTREVIRDYNKQILMRFFAQFLVLGMEQVGTQALVQGSQDFFSMALKSIQSEMLDMWNTQLVPVIMKANPIAGITGYPQIDWADPTKIDVKQLTALISSMVAANIVTPGAEIEDFIRTVAGLPDRPEGVGEGERERPGPQILPFTKGGEEVPPFLYGDRTGRNKAVKAVNSYLDKLLRIYGTWAKETNKKIAQHSDINAMIRAMRASGHGLENGLIQAGDEALEKAFKMGLRSTTIHPAAEPILKAKKEFNRNIITTKFMPWALDGIEQKIREEHTKAKALQQYGVIDLGISVLFDGKAGALLQMGGVAWNAMFEGVKAQPGNQGKKVRWILDPAVPTHCEASANRHGCIDLAKTYDSWDDLPTLPAGEVTCIGNCILPGTVVDAIDIEVLYRIPYKGKALKLFTESGVEFTVTANHPVLTPNGWLTANLLHPGDEVVNSSLRQDSVDSVNNNHKDMPSVIEEIWRAKSILYPVYTTPQFAIMPDNFHSDGRFVNGNIDIIFGDSQLGREVGNTSMLENTNKISLGRGLLAQGLLPADRSFFKVCHPSVLAPDSIMTCQDLKLPLLNGHRLPFNKFGLALGTRHDASSYEGVLDRFSAYTNIMRQLIETYSRKVTLDKIVKVVEFDYVGHVYDLQTKDGYYILSMSQRQGIVNSNCRCSLQVLEEKGWFDPLTGRYV